MNNKIDELLPRTKWVKKSSIVVHFIIAGLTLLILSESEIKTDYELNSDISQIIFYLTALVTFIFLWFVLKNYYYNMFALLERTYYEVKKMLFGEKK